MNKIFNKNFYYSKPMNKNLKNSTKYYVLLLINFIRLGYLTSENLFEIDRLSNLAVILDRQEINIEEYKNLFEEIDKISKPGIENTSILSRYSKVKDMCDKDINFNKMLKNIKFEEMNIDKEYYYLLLHEPEYRRMFKEAILFIESELEDINKAIETIGTVIESNIENPEDNKLVLILKFINRIYRLKLKFTINNILWKNQMKINEIIKTNLDEDLINEIANDCMKRLIKKKYEELKKHENKYINTSENEILEKGDITAYDRRDILADTKYFKNMKRLNRYYSANYTYFDENINKEDIELANILVEKEIKSEINKMIDIIAVGEYNKIIRYEVEDKSNEETISHQKYSQIIHQQSVPNELDLVDLDENEINIEINFKEDENMYKYIENVFMNGNLPLLESNSYINPIYILLAVIVFVLIFFISYLSYFIIKKKNKKNKNNQEGYELNC